MEATIHRLDDLKNCRTAILDRWRELALGVYPERTARFLVREPDRFRNPVGHALGESLEFLYDGLLDEASAEQMRVALDGIVRVRAVQDLSPSAAVGFVLLAKQAIRDGLGEDGPAEADLVTLFERIDRLALRAFDQFMECREQIHALRVREIRGRVPGSAAALAIGGCPAASQAPGDPAGPDTGRGSP